MQESSPTARVGVRYDAGFDGAQEELAMPGILAARRNRFLSLTIVVVALFVSASAQDPGWPRQITKPSGKLVYYQPQVDDWNNYQTINARLAFTITPTGGKTQVGVLAVQMQTSVNMDTHTVLLSNPQINGVTFPSLDPATSEQMGTLVRTFLNPAATMNISLERLVASVKKTKTPPSTELNNEPPTIYISMRPAILLLVNGTPVMEKIANSNLQFVVNANWPLFQVQNASQYYLFNGKGWMTSSSVSGTWTATSQLPAGMSQVPANSNFASLKPYIPAPASSGAAPVVYYSATPAEIIVFSGPPQWTAIPGTQLSYGSNTGSPVFKYAPTGAYYFLTSGRWFTAARPLGPWTFATYNLPPDFAKIPVNSPVGSILASVPGTPEAEDAVLIAQIPTTVTVNPATAASEVRVSYVGSPQFLPITGTTMSYATNTPNRVIQVGAEYYLCYQGIWFVGSTPQGPWQTAQLVPPDIYTIPPSSPVYNVTYVVQQPLPDGNVQASYTAGYMGAFITGAAVGAIVASGTGYYYPPYVYGGFYYPYASTYGYHTYNAYTGAYGYENSAYGPYGSAHWGASYNPNTGTYARGATTSTAYGKQAVGEAYNPYTGASAATHQGSNAYGSWGQSVVNKNGETAYTQHASNAYGSAGTVQTSSGGKGAATSTAYGNTAAGKTSNGDMYAGHDGNVYKNTGSGWQTYNNGSWNDVNKTTAQQSAQSYQQQHPESTNSNYASAQQKAQSNPNYSADQQKAQSYNQQHPSSSGSYNKPSSGSYGDMDQEAQNRARGEAQSHNYSQSQHSGGWGDRSGGGWGGGGGGGFRR
ncbi:MAG: hypothetical protein WBS19_22780 [Candidatus Korobacteraceae bacterium]